MQKQLKTTCRNYFGLYRDAVNLKLIIQNVQIQLDSMGLRFGCLKGFSNIQIKSGNNQRYIRFHDTGAFKAAAVPQTQY